MRHVLALAALLAAAPLLSSCQTGDNSANNAAAMQAMFNPPNACGPGGTADVNQCSSRR